MDFLTLALAKNASSGSGSSGESVGISSVAVNEENHLIFTLTNDDELDAGELPSSEMSDSDIFDALNFEIETDDSTTFTVPFNNCVLSNCIVKNTLTKTGTPTTDNPATYSALPNKVTLNSVDYSIPVDVLGFEDTQDEFDLVTGEFTSKILKMTASDFDGKSMQFRNKATTGNKYMAIRFMNAIEYNNTLVDCNVATIAWLSGANQTEVQNDKNLSISFDYSKADTALANTEFSDVFKDEVVSQLASSNFDGTWSGHTGLIPNTEITRGKMYRAIVAYLNLIGAKWYFVRTNPVTQQYAKTVMPLKNGTNALAVVAGNATVKYDVSNVLVFKEDINLKEFGAVAGDNTKGSANYKALLNAVKTGKRVIIDDTYYITVNSTDNACESVKIDGMGQGKLLVTTASGCVNIFSIKSGSTGVVDIKDLLLDIQSTTNYNIPTLVGVEDNNNTALNMQYVSFSNLHFKKPFALFDLSTAVDEVTTLNYLNVDNCRFDQAHYQYYKDNTFHTRSNVGIIRPVMRMYGVGYTRAVIKDNYFSNCFYVLEDNDNDEWQNYVKEELVFVNNTLKNDDYYIAEAGYISMYTGMVMTRANSLRFINNYMEGLAVRLDSAANYTDDTSTLFATYMATAYCRDVLVEGNIYKNNCNFSTNNQLLKCKLTRTGYDDTTSVKIYRNNSFIVESDWLKKTIYYATDYNNADATELAKIESLGWSFASDYSTENYNSENDIYDFCYSMSDLPIDYMAKSVDISNNTFSIEFLFDTTNFCHAKNTILANNKIEAECLIGTFAKITKITGYSTLITPNDATSHSVHLCDYDNVKVINNSIVEIPAKYPELVTKCTRYSVETDSTQTQNDKFNEVFILCAGFSQQNDLSCENVIIKGNLIVSHRFEFLFAYMNELGHNYNIMKNVLIDNNTVLAKDDLLQFTPAASYLIFSNNSTGKTRKGVFAVYGKGICDAPTSFICSNNLIEDSRTGTEYTASDLASALTDVPNKVMINNYVNGNLSFSS